MKVYTPTFISSAVFLFGVLQVFLSYQKSPDMYPLPCVKMFDSILTLERMNTPRSECAISQATEKSMKSLYDDILQEESDQSKYENHGVDNWAIHEKLVQPPPTHLKCTYDMEEDRKRRFPSCVFDNLYLDVTSNTYYALRLQGDPVSLAIYFNEFDRLVELNELPSGVPAITVAQTTILAPPPHPNYCHGFLEELHCMFWEIALVQQGHYGIDPSRMVFWIARSKLFDDYPSNWDIFELYGHGQTDYKYTWRKETHAAFSAFPLGFSGQHANDSRTWVHFTRIITPGHCRTRTVFVNRHGLYYPSRAFPFEPFSEKVQGKWMLLFGDYLLRRFSVASRFQGDGVLPDERVVIVARRGAGQREIVNSHELMVALREAVQLHVIEYEFGNLRDTMSTMRSTRLLVTPHGAGMSNIIFMRPGSAVLETDSFRCDHQGEYFGQLAKVINLHHRVWVELVVSNSHTTSCSFQAPITLDVEEVVPIAQDLLLQECRFRDAHFQEAVSKVRHHSPSIPPPV